MKKIPTLFVRDEDTGRRFVKNEVNPRCQWVLDGEGLPTRKYDGICLMVRVGKLFKRRQIKVAENTGISAPLGWEPVEYDDETRKWVGWVPVGDGPEDALARDTFAQRSLPDGTYELVGPKVNGNPEGFDQHRMVPHGADVLSYPPRDFDGLRDYLQARPHEGIVWWHEDGRMAKLKRKDFPK